MLISTACATTRPQEIKLPPSRIFQTGYSVLPLNESGWLIGIRNQTRLVLGKKSENPDETYIVYATLVRIGPYTSKEDFLRVIKDSQEKDNPQRFKIVKDELTAVTYKSTDCAKSHRVSEDNAAYRASGNTGVMTLESISLSCAHPKNKGIAIDVGFSQRYYSGHRDSAFSDKANAILNSLEFSDL